MLLKISINPQTLLKPIENEGTLAPSCGPLSHQPKSYPACRQEQEAEYSINYYNTSGHTIYLVAEVPPTQQADRDYA